MSGTRRTSLASLLLFVLLPGARTEAQDYCANGAVNTITGNYVGAGQTASDGEEGLTERCEICLLVRVQEPSAAGGWEEVGRVCDLWTDAEAHEVMFKIGQCGLIVPGGFERGGVFYGSTVPIRIEAVRQPPCP